MFPHLLIQTVNAVGWVSPTGYEDPDNVWTNETNAYDEDTATSAITLIPGGSIGKYIYLTINAITSNKIRIYTEDQLHIPSMQIQIYCDDAWINLGWIFLEHGEWTEKTFTEGTVTQAKIRFQNSGIDSHYAHLNEFDFWSGYVPTNDALTLDLTGASIKGTKTLLPMKQDYKFVYNCSDADGVTDISYAEIRLDYSSKNVILRATRGTGDSWTFTEQSDPSNYVP